ncbi:MAG: 50S ribosomal protein L18 [Parcubacteria group bacterium CG10_big_fil_rev_8_21_14_0_10_38_31]|nr:MAG: 50S ribosomal protein L18 [Parcubacteria group bacterium CG10_big_fil_rev_8_21_14_0_10_38_31]
MNKTKEKIVKRLNRHKRVRAKISGTGEKPRLCVFRSNKNIFLQLIDDSVSKTIVSVSDIKESKKSKLTKTDSAREAGKRLAEEAIKKNIKEVVFDRGGHLYHGRVKAVAEGAREGGLKF